MAPPPSKPLPELEPDQSVLLLEAEDAEPPEDELAEGLLDVLELEDEPHDEPHDEVLDVEEDGGE